MGEKLERFLWNNAENIHLTVTISLVLAGLYWLNKGATLLISRAEANQITLPNALMISALIVSVGIWAAAREIAMAIRSKD